MWSRNSHFQPHIKLWSAYDNGNHFLWSRFQLKKKEFSQSDSFDLFSTWCPAVIKTDVPSLSMWETDKAPVSQSGVLASGFLSNYTVFHLFTYSVRFGLLLQVFVHSFYNFFCIYISLLWVSASESQGKQTCCCESYFSSPRGPGSAPCKEINDTNRKESSGALYGRSHKCCFGLDDYSLCGTCCLLRLLRRRNMVSPW